MTRRDWPNFSNTACVSCGNAGRFQQFNKKTDRQKLTDRQNMAANHNTICKQMTDGKKCFKIVIQIHKWFLEHMGKLSELFQVVKLTRVQVLSAMLMKWNRNLFSNNAAQLYNCLLMMLCNYLDYYQTVHSKLLGLWWKGCIDGNEVHTEREHLLYILEAACKNVSVQMFIMPWIKHVT